MPANRNHRKTEGNPHSAERPESLASETEPVADRRDRMFTVADADRSRQIYVDKWLHLVIPELSLVLSAQNAKDVVKMTHFIIHECVHAQCDPATALQWCEHSTAEIVKRTGKSKPTVLKHLALAKRLDVDMIVEGKLPEKKQGHRHRPSWVSLFNRIRSVEGHERERDLFEPAIVAGNLDYGGPKPVKDFYRFQESDRAEGVGGKGGASALTAEVPPFPHPAGAGLTGQGASTGSELGGQRTFDFEKQVIEKVEAVRGDLKNLTDQVGRVHEPAVAIAKSVDELRDEQIEQTGILRDIRAALVAGSAVRKPRTRGAAKRGSAKGIASDDSRAAVNKHYAGLQSDADRRQFVSECLRILGWQPNQGEHFLKMLKEGRERSIGVALEIIDKGPTH